MMTTLRTRANAVARARHASWCAGGQVAHAVRCLGWRSSCCLPLTWTRKRRDAYASPAKGPDQGHGRADDVDQVPRRRAEAPHTQAHHLRAGKDDVQQAPLRWFRPRPERTQHVTVGWVVTVGIWGVLFEPCFACAWRAFGAAERRAAGGRGLSAPWSRTLLPPEGAPHPPR